MSRSAALKICATGALAVYAASLQASGQVLLKKTFIATYRNRVTITTSFKVDDAHAQPNKIGTSSDDGDLHMAGRSPSIGLPMVVELSNGRLDAVGGVETAIHAAEGTGHAVNITGVWRLWMEHKSAEAMQQGDNVPVPPNTNPKHVFEIHPVTAFSGTPTLETFVPLRDDKNPSAHYQASDAATAFARYEKGTLKVDRTDPVFVSIDGPQIPYNYVEFFLEVAGQATAVDDGTFVLANAYDLEKHVVAATPRRMVLVKGSRPEALIGSAAAGKQFRVLGIPRINLDALMRAAKPNQTTAVVGAYELIILAVIE
jgi:hypothetical protein